jgi:capsular polysaccharide transport system permease protein
VRLSRLTPAATTVGAPPTGDSQTGAIATSIPFKTAWSCAEQGGIQKVAPTIGRNSHAALSIFWPWPAASADRAGREHRVGPTRHPKLDARRWAMSESPPPGTPESRCVADEIEPTDLDLEGSEQQSKSELVSRYQPPVAKASRDVAAARSGGLVPRAEDETRIGEVDWARPLIRRRRRTLTLSRFLFLVTVAIPTAFATVYFGFIASDRYVSTAELTIETVSSPGAPPQSSAQVTNTSSGLDAAQIVMLSAAADYMASHDIVNKLRNKIDLYTIWGTHSADWLSRLRHDANSEDIYDYYQGRVDPSFDQTTGLITLTTEAFRPEDAQALGRAIIGLAEERISLLDRDARSGMARFAESEVERYRKKLEDARLALQSYQNAHSEINSSTVASDLTNLVAGIEQGLAEKRAQLLSVSKGLTANAPSVVVLRSQIKGLESELAAQRERLGTTVPGHSSTYADILTEYNRLQLDQTFANAAYTAALTDAVLARFQANAPHFGVYEVIEPQLPEQCNTIQWSCSSIKPNRPLVIATVFISGLVAFGMLSLIIGAIRAHARNH